MFFLYLQIIAASTAGTSIPLALDVGPKTVFAKLTGVGGGVFLTPGLG
jgi:hypothetical protein